MRIKNIELNNFGSYAGQNVFDFESSSQEERVVVIGGKNGAGKTTLFTAVQVCLYGNYAFGFKTAGRKYLNEIYDLINSQARIDAKESAYLEIRFQQVDDTDLLDYVIRRSWTWPQNELQEEFSVWQNGVQLVVEELVNFQNYLIHLIPPDMLKLYFFDGEKIADYFLSSKEVNIRDALMILSGNDTFDFLHDQVRRVLKTSDRTENGIAQDYMEVSREIDDLQQGIYSIQIQIEDLQETIYDLEAEINRHKANYTNRGGITLEEWTNLHGQLKTEEEKRERLNWQRKAFATESLPFVIASDLFSRILPHLRAEKAYQTHQALKDSLEEETFSKILIEAVESIGSRKVEADVKTLYNKITRYLLDTHWENFSPLFGLSSDEEMQVQAVLNRVHNFDPKTFANYQKRINASLEHSKEIRVKLQESNIEHFEEYVQTLSELEEELAVAQVNKENLQALLATKCEDLEQKAAKLRGVKKAFEEMLKAHSVSNISGKVLLLLEELQTALYTNLIYRVEEDLNKKFRELIRKEDFFSRITVDSDFSVHIIRNEEINKADLISLLRGANYSVATSALGTVAIKCLQDRYKTTSIAELRKNLSTDHCESILLPVVLNKDRLSSGEKQIFVMSLYWAMMNQSKNELPFIIDTPFARIDGKHRANITEYFFKKLTGQLIILSTDEELSSNHLDAMAGQISHVYTLEYGQDKKTHIQNNRYFEV